MTALGTNHKRARQKSCRYNTSIQAQKLWENPMAFGVFAHRTNCSPAVPMPATMGWGAQLATQEPRPPSHGGQGRTEQGWELCKEMCMSSERQGRSPVSAHCRRWLDTGQVPRRFCLVVEWLLFNTICPVNGWTSTGLYRETTKHSPSGSTCRHFGKAAAPNSSSFHRTWWMQEAQLESFSEEHQPALHTCMQHSCP